MPVCRAAGVPTGTCGEVQYNNLPSARYSFESLPLQLNRCICCPSANPQHCLKCRSVEIMLFLSHYRPQPNKRALITQTIFYLLQGLLLHSFLFAFVWKPHLCQALAAAEYNFATQDWKPVEATITFPKTVAS